jgi:hypothetical protein
MLHAIAIGYSPLRLSPRQSPSAPASASTHGTNEAPASLPAHNGADADTVSTEISAPSSPPPELAPEPATDTLLLDVPAEAAAPEAANDNPQQSTTTSPQGAEQSSYDGNSPPADLPATGAQQALQPRALTGAFIPEPVTHPASNPRALPLQNSSVLALRVPGELVVWEIAGRAWDRRQYCNKHPPRRHPPLTWLLKLVDSSLVHEFVGMREESPIIASC